jgi:nitrogen fixation protein FixH
MTDTVSGMKAPISQSNKQAFRNPWVLGLIAGILLVLLVNAGFIVTAVVTNPGLVDKNYYERGRDLEQDIASRRAIRNRLGWQMTLAASAKPVVGKPARYTLNVVDKVGNPVDVDTVTLHAYRPSDAHADFSGAMHKVATGVYSVEIRFPLKGIWDLTTTLSQGDNHLDFTRRVSVQAQ